MLGLLGLFVALAGNASAGGDTKITVNSTANIDDGECEGAPNDDEIGNCTLHEAIDMVNNGDADIINFHKPVFSKEQPGVIELCTGEGELPPIERDIVIDSKNSGVILDGGDKDDDCSDPAELGIRASGLSNGLDFELNGGKNFTIRNLDCGGYDAGVMVTGYHFGDFSLGTVVITGIIVENVCSEGVIVEGTNLESLSITNSDISSYDDDAIEVVIEACNDGDLDCKLSDSVVNITGNRINGATECEGCEEGVDIDYDGRINEDIKVTISVSQNEVINGSERGVEIDFDGCGSGGFNVHVDENEDINGLDDDGVRIIVSADVCEKPDPGCGGECIDVDPGDTSDNLEVVVTVNGNGDIENHDDGQEGVEIFIGICCEESDSSAIVEVNENGRITGESDGVQIDTWICCGDDNSTNVSVNGNDEITGEGDDGISVHSFAGSTSAASGIGASVAGFGPPSDSDDNVCIITVDGNNEIDGVGGETSHGTGVGLNCFAGASGNNNDNSGGSGGTAGAPRSSGDNNVSIITVTNNNDIDGDRDGVDIEGLSGSIAGEADENTFTAIVSGNGEITGDDDDGIDIDIGAGTTVEEGDDNFAEIIIEENQEVGGNGSEGMDLDIFAGGITDGSEDNATAISIIQNGDIEGSGDGGDGIEIDSSVCCDPDNVNTININNNKGEITGHDDDGIDIDTCCSFNIITIMDNEGNIRGGDDDGLELEICNTGLQTDFWTPDKFAGGGGPLGELECLKDSVTLLTVTNNSFSDSEDDGISINDGGTFQDEDAGVKSVISNNIIEGNGDDGIYIESASGLNIGPGNEIFENGTEAGDNGIEIDWCYGVGAWEEEGQKFPANHNTITQNSIYDNFGLGIDLVGYSADGDGDCLDDIVDREGTVGCVPFPETAIAPNDCLSFPELQTQSGDKLIGVACSDCTVEVFWADNDPSNNDDEDGVPHGEGREYIISGTAAEDGSFSIELPCDLDGGDLTATATDKLKNTSEFSANLLTLGTGPCATDTVPPEDTATDTPVPPTATDTPVPPTATNTPVPPKVCGDVNMDGVANSVDASLVLQLKAALISSLPNESSGDVNGDGSLTSVDAALLLQFTAGLIGEDGLNCG